MNACGIWPIGWLGRVNIKTTRLSNGNCERLGISKHPNYYAASKFVKGWTGMCAEARKCFLEITDRSSLILAVSG